MAWRLAHLPIIFLKNARTFLQEYRYNLKPLVLLVFRRKQRIIFGKVSLMHEQQLRHQYLAMLGVSSWISRSPLPSARPSALDIVDFVYDKHYQAPLLEGGTEDSVNSEKSVNNASSTQTSQSLSATLADQQLNSSAHKSVQQPAAHLPELSSPLANSAIEVVNSPLEGVSSRDNTSEPKSNQARLKSTAVMQSSALHTPLGSGSGKDAPIMRLMFWQFADVLVIDSLPTRDRGAILSTKYEKLLTNMLKAMRHSTQRVEPNATPYILNWPTLAGVSIDQGWDQAMSAVQYKLAKIFQQHSPKLVLMLGDYCAQMVMNMEDDFEEMRGVVFLLRAQTRALATYSLTQMLNVPGCKQEVWMDLQKVL